MRKLEELKEKADEERDKQFGDRLTLLRAGRFWLKHPDLRMKKDESITVATFSQEISKIGDETALGGNGVLAGDKGAVFVTQDGGETWAVTGKDWRSTLYDWILAAPENQYPYLVAGEEVHILRKYPGLEYSDEILKEDHILKDSNFAKELRAFQKERETRLAEHSGKTDATQIWGGPISQARIFAGIALFFLLHLLVRIYQYNHRLANFWDSRADAVLLAHQYTTRPAKEFDALVQALAPDAHDFRPLPRLGLGDLFKRQPPPS